MGLCQTTKSLNVLLVSPRCSNWMKGNNNSIKRFMFPSELPNSRTPGPGPIAISSDSKIRMHQRVAPSKTNKTKRSKWRRLLWVAALAVLVGVGAYLV